MMSVPTVREVVAMAICQVPEVDLFFAKTYHQCVCLRDARQPLETVPRCLECLMKADAALEVVRSWPKEEDVES